MYKVRKKAVEKKTKIKRKQTVRKKQKPKVVFVCVTGGISQGYFVKKINEFLKKKGISKKINVKSAGFSKNRKEISGADIIVSHLFKNASMEMTKKIAPTIKNFGPKAITQDIYFTNRGRRIALKRTFNAILKKIRMEQSLKR